MANTLITDIGLEFVNRAGTEGPYFPVKLFLPIYDERIDPTIHAPGVTSGISDSWSEADIIPQGEIIWATGSGLTYTIPDTEYLYLAEGTFVNPNVTNSRFNDTCKVNFRNGQPISTIISGSSFTNPTSGNWTITDAVCAQGYGASADYPSLSANFSSFFSVNSYSPVSSGDSVRGFYKCRLGNEVGNFKFNKIALYACKMNTNGTIDYTQPPVLFAIAALNNPIIKTAYGNNISNIEINVELAFATSGGWDSDVMFTTDNYWVNVPSATSNEGALFYDGRVGIGMSGDTAWHPLAKLHIIDGTGLPQLKLGYSDTLFAEFILNPVGPLIINLSGGTYRDGFIVNYSAVGGVNIGYKCISPADGACSIGTNLTNLGDYSYAFGYQNFIGGAYVAYAFGYQGSMSNDASFSVLWSMDGLPHTMTAAGAYSIMSRFVGIGTVDPTELLTVSGNVGISGDLIVGNATVNTANIKFGNNNETKIVFSQAGSDARLLVDVSGTTFMHLYKSSSSSVIYIYPRLQIGDDSYQITSSLLSVTDSIDLHSDFGADNRAHIIASDNDFHSYRLLMGVANWADQSTAIVHSAFIQSKIVNAVTSLSLMINPRGGNVFIGVSGTDAYPGGWSAPSSLLNVNTKGLSTVAFSVGHQGGVGTYTYAMSVDGNTFLTLNSKIGFGYAPLCPIAIGGPGLSIIQGIYANTSTAGWVGYFKTTGISSIAGYFIATDPTSKAIAAEGLVDVAGGIHINCPDVWGATTGLRIDANNLVEYCIYINNTGANSQCIYALATNAGCSGVNVVMNGATSIAGRFTALDSASYAVCAQGTVSLSGAFCQQQTTISATQQLLDADNSIVMLSNNASSISATLPNYATALEGKIITIKNVSTCTHWVKNTAGAYISPASFFSISLDLQDSMTFIKRGSAWYILNFFDYSVWIAQNVS
jgi:hypothetical protein